MNRQPPLWMTAIIIIFLIPVFLLPVLLDSLPEGDGPTKTFVWIYPFYMLLSAWLAYSAYGDRRHISWILLMLMALSTAALWILTGLTSL